MKPSSKDIFYELWQKDDWKFLLRNETGQSILRRLVVEYEDCLLLSIFTRHNRNTLTRAFRIIFSLFFWPLTFSRDNFIALNFCKVWRGFYSFPLQLSQKMFAAHHVFHLENVKLTIFVNFVGVKLKSTKDFMRQGKWFPLLSSDFLENANLYVQISFLWE